MQKGKEMIWNRKVVEERKWRKLCDDRNEPRKAEKIMQRN